MNICVLFGSPNKKGNTGKLLNIFLEPFRENVDNKIKVFDSFQINAAPCIGCLYCKTDRNCFNNDLDELMNNLISSDLLVVATPVYQYSFPSPLKAIIDRLERFYEPENLFDETEDKLTNGKGVLLVTAGSSGKYSFDILEKQAKMAFLITKKKYMGSLMLPHMDRQSFDADSESKAKELVTSSKCKAKELYDKITAS